MLAIQRWDMYEALATHVLQLTGQAGCHQSLPMTKKGWSLAIVFVLLVTAIAFLLAYQYEKEGDMKSLGVFADLPPNAYWNPIANALPRTVAVGFIAILIVMAFAARRYIAKLWEFVHKHRIAFAFVAVMILCAILFRYHAVYTPRGVIILDRWTGATHGVSP